MLYNTCEDTLVHDAGAAEENGIARNLPLEQSSLLFVLFAFLLLLLRVTSRFTHAFGSRGPAHGADTAISTELPRGAEALLEVQHVARHQLLR